MDFRDLVKVGAHFGHIKSRLNPRMLPYVWGVKNNVHLIDVSKTAYLLEKAAKFLHDVAKDGKPILWVGTKKAAKDSIYDVAQKLKMPYVNHRWIGGTLSNHSQVKKSVTKLMHYEDILSKSEKFHYTKKELNTFNKIAERLRKNIGGIRDLTWPIGAVVLVDVFKELSALKEAATVGVPVIAIVDTNGDPSLVDHVIPANDDSVRTIRLILDFLEDAASKGKSAAKTDKALRQASVSAKASTDKQAPRQAQDEREGEKKTTKVVKKAKTEAAKKTSASGVAKTKEKATIKKAKDEKEAKKPAAKTASKKKVDEKKK